MHRQNQQHQQQHFTIQKNKLNSFSHSTRCFEKEMKWRIKKKRGKRKMKTREIENRMKEQCNGNIVKNALTGKLFIFHSSRADGIESKHVQFACSTSPT